MNKSTIKVEAPQKASSVISDSLFGADEPKPSPEALLFGRNAENGRFRLLSIFSVASATSSTRVNDTLISLLVGCHASRKAVGDSFTSSPCFKPKHVSFPGLAPYFKLERSSIPSNDHHFHVSQHPSSDRLQ